MSSKDSVYCIILTKYRLLQGLALIRSLSRYTKNPKVYVLCMDSETYDALEKMKLENLFPIRLSRLENDQLLDLKQERKLNEYCWTLKPHFIEYLLYSLKHLERVTYLDADLYFYDDIERIFKETPYCSVLLSKHNYPAAIDQFAATCGKYNSGFVSVRNCDNGVECIQWWKKKCMNWCREVPENGRFGDQKYLDAMPFLFKRACSVKTPGVNIAPWNQVEYEFKKKNDNIYVNDKRLIFYHFCGLRVINRNEAALTMTFEKEIIPMIYEPYFMELQQIVKDVKTACPELECFFIEEGRKKDATIIKLNDI